MSCNTKTSLAAVIDAVNAQLNNNYVDRDDPRINQGVFTEPTIRGGLMLDEAAKLDFCGYVTECGQREPFGKQWVDRPLYPDNTLVSYEDEGEIKSRWQDLANLSIDAAMVVYMPAGEGAIPTDVGEGLRRRVTPYDFGAVDGQDASDALDKFASFVLLNPNLLYDVTGDFKISRPWLFYHQGVKAIHWNLQLTTAVPMQCALSLEGTNVVHKGKIAIRGRGTVSNWNTFPLDYGVVISGCQGSSLPSLSVSGCRIWGVVYNENGSIGIPLRAGQTYKNNTMLEIDSIHGRDCGGYNSGYGEAGTGALNNLGFVSKFSNPIRSGSSGTPNQRTTIDVDILPPVAASSTAIFAVINNEVFRVHESSGTSGGGSITIFPWIPLDWEVGEVKYIFGGVFGSGGSNGGPTKVGKVDSMRCAISVLDGALYGSTVLQHVAQFCSIGLAIGVSANSVAPQSSATIGFYTEAVFRNIVHIGVGSSTIINRYGAFAGEPYKNCEYIHPLGASYNHGFKRVFMPSNDTSLSLAGLYSKRPGNVTESGIDLDANSCVDIVVQRNSWTVRIKDVTNENKNTGLDFATIKAIGTGSRGAPTGSFTFNAPSGWTVNGVGSVVLSGFYEVAEFLVSWDFTAKNARVNCISRRGSTATPTTGDWVRGDTVFNTTPAEDGVVGWECITSGAPGVWIPIGGSRRISTYTQLPTGVALKDLPLDEVYWFAASQADSESGIPLPSDGIAINGTITKRYSHRPKGDTHNITQEVAYEIKGEIWRRNFSTASGAYGSWSLVSYTVLKGTTTERPVNPALGHRYYDTTLLASGKPISWNGSAWVDALGAEA